VVTKTIKVPLAYSPKKRWIQKLNETVIPITQVIPRMSFEYKDITYDPLRKLNTIGKHYGVSADSSIDLISITSAGSGYTDATPPIVVITGGGGSGATAVATVAGGIITSVVVTDGGKNFTSAPVISFDNTAAGGLETPGTALATLVLTQDIINSVSNPVPYNFNMDLNVITKNLEDGHQILEQILPFFTPSFNVTINEIPSLGIKRDVSVVLNDVAIEDNGVGGFDETNITIYTLNFFVKTNFYGPVTQGKIIKTVIANTSLTPDFLIDNVIQTAQVTPSTAGIDDVFTIVETITYNI
jgi:hypothetical protein